MSDTRPIVALYDNSGGPAFVGRMLRTEDVTGHAVLQAADNQLRIPDAFVSSSNIEAGLKGVIEEGMQDGMIFLRWKAIHALLKYQDGKRNIDIIRTRQKFDEYVMPPAVVSGEASAGSGN